MKKQQGFTLIELIVVIVILGILAATALPKFIDLSSDARKAAAQGVAAALAGGSTINYSKDLVLGQTFGATGASAVAKAGVTDTMTTGCADLTAMASLATGVSFAATGTGTYNVTGGAPATIGASATCTVVNNDDVAQTAQFALIGAK